MKRSLFSFIFIFSLVLISERLLPGEDGFELTRIYVKTLRAVKAQER